MTLSAWIAVSELILAITWFEIYLIYGIVRSLLKKPINSVPSLKKWECVHAELVSEECVTYTTIRPPETKHKLKYNVRYNYNGCSYTGKIDGYTLKGKKAVIYCRIKNPAVIKEYIPVQPWSRTVIISAGFITTLIIIFKYVMLSQIILH